jgi:hypothetical protein
MMLMDALRIVPIAAPPIPRDRRKTVEGLAARYRRDEKAFDTCRSFHPLVHQGLGVGSALVLADQGEIALFSNRVPSLLEYRMTALTDKGDMLLVHRRERSYEHYLSKYLGLRDIEFIESQGSSDRPIIVQCLENATLLSRICEQARKAGGLTLHSYLTSGNVWRFAQAVAQATNVPISVCGPSSRISRRANDKLWFSDCVRQLFGPEAIPPSYAAYGPAAAIGQLRRLARRSARVVVKVPSSAGSLGNIAFERDYIEKMDNAQLRRQLLDLLYARGWRDAYPFLVGVWNCAVKSSPSVQMWIPNAEEGDPVAEGIFEQNVTGPHGTFVGASRSRLPTHLRKLLLEEALTVGLLFQKLGYFGRCSLDAIVPTDNGSTRAIQWIECNGRWGGVSLPMTLVHRLVPPEQADGLVVVQHKGPDVPVRRLAQILARLDNILVRADSPHCGIILTSPPDPGPAQQISFAAVAPEQSTASQLAIDAISRISADP